MSIQESNIEERCDNCEGLERVECPKCFGNLEDVDDCTCDDGEIPCPECT